MKTHYSSYNEPLGFILRNSIFWLVSSSIIKHIEYLFWVRIFRYFSSKCFEQLRNIYKIAME